MRRIGFVLTPGFHVMSFAALPVFEYASKEIGEPVYDLASAVRDRRPHGQLDRRQRRDRAVPPRFSIRCFSAVAPNRRRRA